jgi:hypothetical protein
MEPRDMAQTIDSTWLADNAAAFGGDATKGPWVLGVAFGSHALPTPDGAGNYPYALATDVTSDGTAFTVASDVSFDLGGHVVTYGNAAIPYDEGFESGTIGLAPAGWDMGGSGGVIAANTGYLFGANVLRVAGFAVASGQNTGNSVALRSPSIAIPAAGVTCTAKLATSRDGGNAQNFPVPKVQLQVCKVADDSVVADSAVASAVQHYDDGAGNNHNGGDFRGLGAICSWVPADTAAVYLKITVTAWRGSGGGTTTAYSDHVHLDAVRLTRSYVHGFVATNDTSNFPGATNLPAAMRTGTPSYTNCGRFALTDSAGTGSIVQGAGKGYAADPVFSYFHRHARSFTNLHISPNGDDVSAIYGATRVLTDTAGVVATGNTIAYPAQATDIIYRDFARSAINFDKLKCPGTVSNNTFTGLPNAAITLAVTAAALGTGYALVADANAVTGDTVATNGYFLKCWLTDNLAVTNNTVGGYCRGLILDVLFDTPAPLSQPPISNVTVSGNTIDVREKGNREYGPYKARALRLRNDAFTRAGPFANLTFTNNLFRARCGNGYAIQAEGATISVINTASVPTLSTGIRFSGNTFEAITEDSVPTNLCIAMTYEDILPAGQDVQFSGDVFRSSQQALVLADFDGAPLAGVFLSTQSVRSTLGDTATLAFYPVRAGYNGATVGPIALIGHRVDAGSGLRAYAPATDTLLYPPQNVGDSGTKTILAGWPVTPHVIDAGTSAALAGAMVSVKNGAGATDSSGTTDPGGHAALYALTTRWTGTGSFAATPLGPHSVTATATGCTPGAVALGTVSAAATPELPLAPAAAYLALTAPGGVLVLGS